MCVEADAVMAEPIESIPEASPAERVVADVLPIGAPPGRAERVRDSVPAWFHTFALAPGIYTPGISRDHGYRLAVLGADRFAGGSVLDVGAFDGFYSFLAEARGARRVVAVDNEQYVAWVRTRFGVTLPGGAGFRAIAELLDSRVDYHRMDALHVRELGERFDSRRRADPRRRGRAGDVRLASAERHRGDRGSPAWGCVPARPLPLLGFSR